MPIVCVSCWNSPACRGGSRKKRIPGAAARARARAQDPDRRNPLRLPGSRHPGGSGKGSGHDWDRAAGTVGNFSANIQGEGEIFWAPPIQRFSSLIRSPDLRVPLIQSPRSCVVSHRPSVFSVPNHLFLKEPGNVFTEARVRAPGGVGRLPGGAADLDSCRFDGEVSAVHPLVRELRARYPKGAILLSTTTASGIQIARERVREANAVSFSL